LAEVAKGKGGGGVPISMSNLLDISSHFFVIEKGGYFAIGIELLYLSYVEQRYPKSE
jgi:hypothetical protein